MQISYYFWVIGERLIVGCFMLFWQLWPQLCIHAAISPSFSESASIITSVIGQGFVMNKIKECNCAQSLGEFCQASNSGVMCNLIVDSQHRRQEDQVLIFPVCLAALLLCMCACMDGVVVEMNGAYIPGGRNVWLRRFKLYMLAEVRQKSWDWVCMLGEKPQCLWIFIKATSLLVSISHWPLSTLQILNFKDKIKIFLIKAFSLKVLFWSLIFYFRWSFLGARPISWNSIEPFSYGEYVTQVNALLNQI